MCYVQVFTAWFLLIYSPEWQCDNNTHACYGEDDARQTTVIDTFSTVPPKTTLIPCFQTAPTRRTAPSLSDS
uniref:Putative secreted protein n=1 Tax=Rhipicephalus microplus TaxID=6941 RepID=A0A6G5A6G1_RHIMP